MEAEHSFSLLKFYYREITSLLHRRAEDFHKTADEIDEENKRQQRPFDKEYFLRHFDVYSEFYPSLFRNSFVLWACSTFESHSKRICDLIKDEHKMPYSWDELDKDKQIIFPTRINNYLWQSGVLLKDDEPTITYPPPDFVLKKVYDENRFVADRLWFELRSYFRVRNCITHYGGSISNMGHHVRIRNYASKKGILANKNGQQELQLTDDFNNEVCDTMYLFFDKLRSIYYCIPLPE